MARKQNSTQQQSEQLFAALTVDQQTELLHHAEAGYELLKFPPEAAPDAIIYGVYRFVDNWQAQRNRQHHTHHYVSGPDVEAVALKLGIVWGEQIVRTLEWDWMRSSNTFTVVAADREYFLYPTYWLQRFLFRGPFGWKNNTIVELYNALKAGDRPVAPLTF